MKVRLENYDWIVLSHSGGKDSSAMTDLVVRRACREGLANKLVIAHADIPEDWPGTRELVAEHAAHYGVRLEVVAREQGGFLDLVRQRHAALRAAGKDAPPWPSPQSRLCTSSLKRGQIDRLFTRLAAETRALWGPGRKARILNCMGMRAEESPARAKLLPFCLNQATNGRRIVHTWLPIFGWGVQEVWARCREAGTRVHPAYGLGMGRLSCALCIFAPRDALMLAGKYNPELLDRYCEVEEEVGYSFQARLSLREVRDALRRGEEPGPVRDWAMT